MRPPVVFNDGGRAAAGRRGTTGDCGVRAIAIALDLRYEEAYKLVAKFGQTSRLRRDSRSTPTRGVWGEDMRRLMASLGWAWTPTMGIGSGTTVRLRQGCLPMGRIICHVSKHYVAVINGVVHDNQDPTRDGTRCVYGYYSKFNSSSHISNSLNKLQMSSAKKAAEKAATPVTSAPKTAEATAPKDKAAKKVKEPKPAKEPKPKADRTRPDSISAKIRALHLAGKTNDEINKELNLKGHFVTDVVWRIYNGNKKGALGAEMSAKYPKVVRTPKAKAEKPAKVAKPTKEAKPAKAAKVKTAKPAAAVAEAAAPAQA